MLSHHVEYFEHAVSGPCRLCAMQEVQLLWSESRQKIVCESRRDINVNGALADETSDRPCQVLHEQQQCL